ncbi:UNVERIFIED_CONTAM: hypothetical protein RMT77_002435 [Armadillidium vulgare]
MSVRQIITALKNLRIIGLPSDSFLIESLENDLLWNLKKVTVSSLLSILEFQHQYVETEKQKKVVEEAVLALEEQWTDVRVARDFQIIYSLCNIFSADFMKNIEDHLAEKASELNILDLSNIIIAISQSKRRPLPLLRSLGYQMFKQNDLLSPQKIKNVFYALDTLSYYDDALLGKLSSDFLDQIKNVKNPSIIGTVSYCVGHMHWKDKTFLNGLATWVVDNIDECKPNDIVNLITALATVNHIPDNIDELISTCISKLDFSLMSNTSIVNVVWSLTLLGQVTGDQMAKVLEPSFVSQFPIDNPSCIGSYLKILNINAASELIYTSYSGPKLQLNSNNFEKLSITRSRDDLTLHNQALKILHNFLPPPKYIRENIKTIFGFIVDAELIVDKNCKPLDLTDYSSSLAGNSETKDLPEGAHKVAIMIWNFKDYNKGLFSLTGPNAFAIKLLNKKGYKVVQIPYNEVSRHGKSLKAVQNFEEKVKKSLQM